MAKIQINTKLINEAAQRAIADTAFLYGRENTEVISEPGAFPSTPEDIVDTGALRSSQQVSKVSDNEYLLSWNVDYALYVHEGYTLRNGNRVEGRPWTEEARKRLDINATFSKLLGSYL